MSFTARHQMLAFYGVPNSGGTVTYTRMKYFTQFSQNKNPQEYNRKYVDEKSQRTDITGFAPQMDYAFDRYSGNPVLTDIVSITNNELIGSEAIRSIVLVDTVTGEAFKRDYSVIPSTEGDDANVYTHSGSFKANGEQISGTATSSDNWQTVTFEATDPSVSFVSSSVSVAAGSQVMLAVEVSPLSRASAVAWSLEGDSGTVRLGNSNQSTCAAFGLTAGTATVKAQITVDGTTYSDTCTVTVTAS